MNQELDENEGISPRPISRRTVALGAAWSVPVIITAVAAPAAAASTAPPAAVVAATVTADKDPAGKPGTKYVHFAVTLTNTGTAAATVDVLSVASSDPQGGSQENLPQTVVVPAGGNVVVSFRWKLSGNAGSATYTISYRVSGAIHTVAKFA